MSNGGLKSLKSLEGKDNPGGLTTRCYVALIKDMLSIKKLKTTTGFTDAVEIDGEHTFKASPAGLGYYQMYMTLDSAEGEFKKIGERDGRSNDVQIKMFHPGNSKEAAVVERKLKNEPCILIIEYPDGTYEQIGSEALPCEIMGDHKTGKVSGGRNGWDFTAQAYQMSKQFYPSDAVFTLATI